MIENTVAIAEAYDGKIKAGINNVLAQKDQISFNHNGIVLKETNDTSSQTLHTLEKNLTEHGMTHLDVDETSTGLDAGCGGGGCSIMIHQKFKCNVEGFTLSQGQVDFANASSKKWNCQNSCKFQVGNILNLPIEDNKYDFIWACESTEHIFKENLSALFNEFARVSKPGATMILIAWIGKQDEHKDGTRIKKLIDDHYLTDIHTESEYLTASIQNSWKLNEKEDLTEKSLPYWKLRNQSEHATGSEKYFIEGFKYGSLSYKLFKFQRGIN